MTELASLSSAAAESQILKLVISFLVGVIVVLLFRQSSSSASSAILLVLDRQRGKKQASMHEVTSDFRMHELSNSLSVPVVLACFHDDASIAQLPNKKPAIDSKTLHAIRKVVRTHFAGPIELDLLCRQSDTLEMFTRETVQSVNTQFPGTLQKLKVCELQTVVQPKFVEDHPPSNALDTSPAKGYSYKVHSRSALGRTGISVLVFIDHANCAHQRAWTRRARTGTM